MRTSERSGQNVRVIPARELAASHAAAWAAMQEADPALVSPFFRPEFTASVAAARDDVFVAILENGGEPVAFFPFQREAAARTGGPVGGPLSDYQGIIASPGVVPDASWLVRACGLDAWRFDHLPAAQASFQPYHRIETFSPAMDLSSGYESYIAERRHAGSEQVTKAMGLRRKLEREIGPLHCTMHSADPTQLRTLMRWKSAQYLASGKTDLFAIPWIVQVVETIHARQADGFAGMLSVLTAGGEPVAMHLGMRSRTECHFWFPAYAPGFAKYSPGILLLLDMARGAAPLGIRTIDFGKGAALYKQRLMNRSVPLAEGSVPASPWRAAAQTLRRRAKTWLRQSPLSGPARKLNRWRRGR